MGEPRRFHDIGHAEPVGALIAKCRRRHLEQLFVSLFAVVIGVSHLAPLGLRII